MAADRRRAGPVDMVKYALGSAIARTLGLKEAATHLTVRHALARGESMVVTGASPTSRIERAIAPMIVECATQSLVIDDPDGVLYTRTAEHRRNIGPCWCIDWSGPEGERLNFLTEALPGGGVARHDRRDRVIDEMVREIVPGKEQDRLVTHTRELVAGIAQYLIECPDDDPAPPPPSWPRVAMHLDTMHRDASEERKPFGRPLDEQLLAMARQMREHGSDLDTAGRDNEVLAAMSQRAREELGMFLDPQVMATTRAGGRLDRAIAHAEVSTVFLLTNTAGGEAYRRLDRMTLDALARIWTRDAPGTVRFVLPDLARIGSVRAVHQALWERTNVTFTAGVNDQAELHRVFGKGISKVIERTRLVSTD